MADNINLIPAAELPLTEAKEVDVLCVEGGELKRKAAGNLGGGGGYVIHVPAEEISASDQGTIITLSESYDNFMPIIEAGGSVWLDLTKDPTMAEMGALFVALPVIGVFYLPGMGLMLLASNGASGGMIQVICTNGTWTPETEG